MLNVSNNSRRHNHRFIGITALGIINAFDRLMKILVLDDEQSIIDLLIEMLRGEHAVEGATTAENALEMLGHGEYDVVFVDYYMPNHDGIWFMKHVSLPKKTTAVLLTGNLNKPLLVAMFRLGIAGYLTKPFSLEDVKRQLDFYSHTGTYANYSASA